MQKSTNNHLLSDCFSNKEIGSQPVTKISWGTIINIIFKSSSHEEMLTVKNTMRGTFLPLAVSKHKFIDELEEYLQDKFIKLDKKKKPQM